MGLIQVIMFYMLVIQCVLVVFLSIPYGNRMCQWVAEVLDKSIMKIEAVRRLLQFSLFLVVVLFAQNMYQIQKYHNLEKFTTENRNKQVLAQRDAYITGFNLFNMLLLQLVYSKTVKTNELVAENMTLKAQVEEHRRR